MPRDIITAIRIEGFRSIERLELDLRGLVVLIGNNGSGKSTLIEACEILRRASSSRFWEEFHQIHGGLFSVLRIGSSRLRLGITIEGLDEKIRYEFALAKEGEHTVIESEQLDFGPSPGHKDPLRVIERDRTGVRIYGPDGLKPTSVMPIALAVMAASGPFAPHPAITRTRSALENIEVHVPFEVTSGWIASAHGRRADLRSSIQLQPADRLERLATNLPNVFAALRNEFGEAHWRETLDYIRLGLGDEVETVTTRAGGVGTVSLWLKLRNLDDLIPPSGIADGVLTYLAFVGLCRLSRPDRTLLAFDEPEIHLHPELLVRVLDFLGSMATNHPVLLATHSDRLLDALQKPADQVRICERGPKRNVTGLRRLDPVALQDWLQDYRGVGDINASGNIRDIVQPEFSLISLQSGAEPSEPSVR